MQAPVGGHEARFFFLPNSFQRPFGVSLNFTQDYQPATDSLSYLRSANGREGTGNFRSSDVDLDGARPQRSAPTRRPARGDGVSWWPRMRVARAAPPRARSRSGRSACSGRTRILGSPKPALSVAPPLQPLRALGRPCRRPRDRTPLFPARPLVGAARRSGASNCPGGHRGASSAASPFALLRGTFPQPAPASVTDETPSFRPPTPGQRHPNAAPKRFSEPAYSRRRGAGALRPRAVRLGERRDGGRKSRWLWWPRRGWVSRLPPPHVPPHEAPVSLLLCRF